MENNLQTALDLQAEFEGTTSFVAWINSDIYPDGRIYTKEYTHWLEKKVAECINGMGESRLKLKDEAIEKYATDYAERVCNGQFPITYTREQVVNHTKGDFLTGAKAVKSHVLNVLNENYEAAKRLTDEDKVRPAQELLLETYEDLISIFSQFPPESGANAMQGDGEIKKAFVAGALTDLFNTWNIPKEQYAKEKADEYVKLQAPAREVRSAEEILLKHLTYGENTYLAGQQENIISAMQEYANQFK